jgi:ribosome-associated translation inhibitor RaiA
MIALSGKEKVMRYEIRRRGVKVTEGLQAHVAERLQLALARFAGSVGEVRVYLRDINGPRGGLDKECRIVVVSRYGRVVVTGTDTDIHAAVTRTARRAGFAMRRRVKRRLVRRRPGRGAKRVPARASG